MRAVRFAVLLLGLVCGSLPAFAADIFPTRPIKFVVGFLAGGPNDTIARIFCDWLQPHLGAPCVVENKVGQGGMIAAKSVIDSPPDGLNEKSQSEQAEHDRWYPGKVIHGHSGPAVKP